MAALDPADEYAWASLGATRLVHGEAQAALTALDRALELKPDYSWALIRRARVWRELGDPGRRLADLDRAVALDPGSPWAHCERGDALRAAGRDEEALAAYDLAPTLDPGYASAYASRGSRASTSAVPRKPWPTWSAPWRPTRPTPGRAPSATGSYATVTVTSGRMGMRGHPALLSSEASAAVVDQAVVAPSAEERIHPGPMAGRPPASGLVPRPGS
ncbi:tetratricopeptide repeat protein [Streptomyces sp. NPDC001758]